MIEVNTNLEVNSSRTILYWSAVWSRVYHCAISMNPRTRRDPSFFSYHLYILLELMHFKMLFERQDGINILLHT